MKLPLDTIQYYLSAKTLKSYSKDSFVYDFVLSVMDTSKEYASFSKIEWQREQYLRSKEYIDFIDFGTGENNGKRSIREIAKTSLSRPVQCRMLFQIINRYRCQKIIELGTSLGISTLYLAAANTRSDLVTLEGNPTTVTMVRKVFAKMGCENVRVVEGDFQHTLPRVLNDMQRVDFVFFDGNHALEPTLDYVERVLPYCHEDTVLVFDDIYWSRDMQEAWKTIIRYDVVTLALDLYFMGVVFFRNIGEGKVVEKLIQSRYKPI